MKNQIISEMVATLGEGISEEERICMYRSLEKISENLSHTLATMDVSD